MGSEAKVSRGEVEVVVAGCEGVAEVVVGLSLKVESLWRGTGDLWSAGEAMLIQLMGPCGVIRKIISRGRDQNQTP